MGCDPENGYLDRLDELCPCGKLEHGWSTMESKVPISLDPDVWKFDSSLNSCMHDKQLLKQNIDETPMTGSPKADALKLALENLPKDDSYDDVRAVLVDKHKDAVLEATRMNPSGARLDDCEAAVGRAAKRRQEAEDIIKIAADSQMKRTS